MNLQTITNPEPRRLSLAECAEIRIGYTPTPRSADWKWDAFGNSDTNSAPMLQPSDIDPLGGVSWDSVRRVQIDGSSAYQSHQLRDDDVILSLRGTNRAVHITGEMLGVARERAPKCFGVIASSGWAVLVPNRQVVQSAFLAWLLNEPPTAERLHASQVGAAIAFLKVSTIREFEVSLPSLAVQSKIGVAHALVNRVQQLENQRATRCRTYLGGLISNNLRQTTTHKRPTSGK